MLPLSVSIEYESYRHCVSIVTWHSTTEPEWDQTLQTHVNDPQTSTSRPTSPSCSQTAYIILAYYYTHMTQLKVHKLCDGHIVKHYSIQCNVISVTLLTVIHQLQSNYRQQHAGWPSRLPGVMHPVSQCWLHLHGWHTSYGNGDPIISPRHLLASIGCASWRESSSRSPSWQCTSWTCSGVPRPTHPHHRPAMSHIVVARCYNNYQIIKCKNHTRHRLHYQQK